LHLKQAILRGKMPISHEIIDEVYVAQVNFFRLVHQIQCAVAH
jgi:hypothetical protein